MQLQALCYANRNLTDGFIPYGVAESFLGRGSKRLDGDQVWAVGETSGMAGRDLDEGHWIELMVAARLWEPTAGGYRIHDYDQYQPSKSEVLAQRKRHAKNQQAYQQRKDADRVSDRLTDGVPVPVPVPVPQSRSVRLRVIAPAPRVKRASPKTPWPESFHLDDDLRAFAREGGLDPELEFGKCKDHALANGVLHADWRRAFRYWCRNAVEFRERRGARR